MKIKWQIAQILCLSLVAGISIPAWADNGDSTPPKNSAADVTMTVIPNGDDVNKTVTQNITVPEKDNEDTGLANKPGAAPATGSKADNGEQEGQDTADDAKEMEDSKEASQAAEHEAQDASQQAEHSAEQEKQAAESQAQQAEQSDQESQSSESEHTDTPTPDNPTPPSSPTPPGG